MTTFDSKGLRLLLCAMAAFTGVALAGKEADAPLETRSIVKPAVQPARVEKSARPASKVFGEGAEIADTVFLKAPAAEEFKQSNPDPEQKGALRIGIVRPLAKPYVVEPRKNPKWSRTRDAGKVLALVVQSEGAEGIRINLRNVRLPQGARLIVTSLSDPDQSVGPYGSKDVRASKDFWTETVFAEAVVLECQLDPGVDEGAVSFDIVRVAHVYVKFSELVPPKVGNCHNDVTCAEADWRNVGNGVAGIGSIGDAGFLWCTGTLLNNTAENFIDYFLTANHCVANQTEASSTEFYWFYQTATCNGIAPNPVSVPRTGGGAAFLAGRSRYLGSDFALLRLRNATPGGVTYVGWTATQPAISSPVRGIHHPDGSFKRISYGTITLRVGNYWRVVWSSGVTEPGSSGSPLFNSSRQLVGQLYGGYSACDYQTGPDEYGRFDVTFPYVSQWLQPAATTPTNDNFANAGVASGVSGQASGGNANGTKETGEPNHAGNSGGRSVWWRWTAQASGPATINTFGSNFDTLLAVYTGTAVNSLTQVAANDDSGTGNQSEVTFNATAGTIYRIAVDGYNAASGNVVLNWSSEGTPPPAGTRINCGGTLAAPWAADRGYSRYSYAYRTYRTVQNAGDVPQAVLRCMRYGPSYRPLSYSLTDIPPGDYLVRLHFVDFMSYRAGSIVFNVDIEGTRVLSSFDVYAAAGGRDRAIVREFEVGVDGDGLQLAFGVIKSRGFVNAIEVIPVDKSRSRAGPGSSAAGLPSAVWASGSDGKGDAWNVVDGDLSTSWTGDAGAGSWWIALGYPRLVSISGVNVFHAEGSLTDMSFVGSVDGMTWFDLDDALSVGPADLRYLWIQFTPGESDDGSVPRIREIEVEQAER